MICCSYSSEKISVQETGKAASWKNRSDSVCVRSKNLSIKCYSLWIRQVAECTRSDDDDTEDDGIKDGVEAADHDGVLDAGETDPYIQEFRTGTDPSNKDSRPEKSKAMPWVPLLLLGD